MKKISILTFVLFLNSLFSFAINNSSETGELKFENKTLQIHENGLISRFIDGEHSLEIIHLNLNEKNAKVRLVKAQTNEESDYLLIENEKDFIELHNIKSIDVNTISFDLKASNGKELKKVTFKSSLIDTKSLDFNSQNIKGNFCPWCLPVVAAILAAAVDILSDDVYSVCSQAIKTCEAGGGLATMTVTHGGWFSSDSCTVSCKDKK